MTAFSKLRINKRKNGRATRIAKRLQALSMARRLRNFRFDVVQLSPEASLQEVFGAHTFLDLDAIDNLMADAQSDQVGAVRTKNANLFWSKVARRVAGRFAKELSIEAGISQLALTNAMEYTFWIEICLISPLRQLARAFSKKIEHQIILIALNDAHFTFLSGFERKQMAAIYLYAELYRLGCPVFFVRRSKEKATSLSFCIKEMWGFYNAPADKPDVDSSALMAASGMRKPSACVASFGRAIHKIAGPYSADDVFTHNLAAGVDPLPDIVVELTPQKNWLHLIFNRRMNRLTLHSSNYISPNLFDNIVLETKRYVREMVNNTDGFVKRYQLIEAHVCDHLFFHSSIAAHIVSKHGGLVTLWPHSSNPVHYDSVRAYTVSRIYCATQSSARPWRIKYPNAQVIIRGELVLSPAKTTGTHKWSLPSIVLIGGADRLNFMPLYDRNAHAKSLRDFTLSLKRIDNKLRVFFKTKPGFQEEDYFQMVLSSTGIKCITDNPLSLNMPHLIFVSVTLGSTLLLEAIASNAISMIVRDFPVNDYTTIEAGAIPVASKEVIVDLIRSCCCETTYHTLLDRQKLWLRQETGLTL